MVTDHPWYYDILDAATGEPLPLESPWGDVFYVDDEAGVLRYYLRDATGSFVLNSDGRSVAWAEIRRPIRIVEKVRAQKVSG